MHQVPTDGISIANLLTLGRPPHWPRSSFYCVRSALRRLSTKFPPHERFPVSELPKILDLLITEDPQPPIQTWSLFTYRSRILRLAAEYACGHPLRPWEARSFFDRLSATSQPRVRKETVDERTSSRR